MRKILLLAFVLSNLFLRESLFAQSCVPTNLNNTVINLSCGNPCTSIRVQVPHLKSTETYALTSIPYTPFQYVVTTGGTEDVVLYADDQYSGLFSLPFSFCFYDSTYTKAVIGSNGLITFDETNAGTDNSYPITEQIPYAGGTPDLAGDTYYPKASIMGAYSDLDPRAAKSPADRKIQWRVEGVAPCRKFIVSYFHVGTYGADSCSLGTVNPPRLPSPNTFQMVMYESTGLIDVYIENKTCTPSTDGGNAILGVQNWDRNAAVAAPGKNGTQWSSINEGYRFTPNGNTSLFVSSQLLNMSGAVLMTADTSTTVQGLLDISFPNICPGPGATQYVVRTTFNSCPAGTIMVSLDTITIQRNNTLPVTTTLVQPTCGSNSGTITVNVATGVGTTPYSYSINGGPAQASNVFSGLAAGTYTIHATDATGCDTTYQVTLNAISNLTANTSFTASSCPGANTGSITVVPTSGVGPFSYTLNPGGVTNTTGIFTNLAPGVYTVTYTDVNTCNGIANATITPGTSITATPSFTPTSCAGASNGTITITPNTGTAPYTYSLDGGAPQASGIFNGVSAGPHSVLVRDANGCTVTVPVTVTSGTGLTGAITSTPATCPGINDGTVTLTAPFGTSPGTPPYLFSLDGGPTQTANTFTGVSAGLHTVTFTDANGCQGTRSINVSGGTPPATTATSANTSCAGASDGVIVFNPVPGSTYTLNPGAISNTTGTFTGLGTGIYTLSITTAGGCSGTVTPSTVTIGPGPALSGTATAAATSCPGVNNGTVTVNPVGTGTTTYTLNPGAVSNTTGVFNNLAAGTYTVTFVTSAGCTGAVSPNPVVSSGTAVSTTAATAATCTGGNNGSITVAPLAAGTTYTLNPGAVTNTTGIFTGLGAGTYTVTFVTPVGCTGAVSPNPVVSANAPLSSAATTATTTCPGVNDGTITVNPVGAGTTYTLNPGAISNTTGIFTGLTAGTYTVTFVTGAGCTGSVSPNPVVNAGPAVSSTATTAATSCPGVSDGTVTVNPVGTGTTYTLNPGAVSNTTGIFTGLGAGTYTVTFLTGAGCTGTVSPNPVVSPGPAIVGTATTNNTSCPTVNNGTITVTTPLGAGTTYTITPGGASNTTGIFTGLAPNTYTISFVTAAGCTGTVSPNPVVTAGPLLSSAFAQINPVCNNINNGVISITPQAGTTAPYTATLTGPGGPYNYTGNAPIVFSNLAPGTYNYSYAEAGGCTGTGGPVTLVTNPPIYTPAALTNLSCNNSANGRVTFSPVGGVAPYQYSSNGGGTYQTSGTFNGLIAGPHTFRIRDNVGCTKDTTITLTQPTVLTATLTGTTPAGCSNNDGTASATAAGGTAPYSYTIAGGTTNTTGSATGIFTGLANGPYTIRVTDSKGCTATATGTVGLTDNMFLTLGPDVTICAESSVTFNPQTNPETNIFTWTGINGTATSTITDPGIKNAVARPTDTATYVLHAQWGGCERWDTIIVNLLHKPVPNAGLDTAICNLTYAILRGSATNLSGTINYAWSPATNVEFPNQAVTRVYPANSDTTYTYTLTVTDNYGCNFSVTDQVDIRVQPPVPAFAGNDTTAVLGSPHQLMASGGQDYLWSPSAPLNNATAQNPLATLQADQKFVVRVTDFAGCIGYDTVFVEVYAGPAYYIPNAFTPNGDGLNDVFRPVPTGIAKTEYFRVFNRYGETIFETNQYMKGWDGTFKGKKQPIGAYVWIIKGIDRNGKKIEMKGTVMLVQ